MELATARVLAAEAIGTFALVFAGAGAVMVDAKTGALGHVGVAITFGLVIMVMIYAVGHISGAHFNGAVTFAFALTRHFPWPRAAGYWSAQLTGAIVAALLLRASLGDVADVGATLPAGSQAQSFFFELVMTAFLMFVILAVATDTRAVGEAAAIAIGGTIALDAMFGGPISGASMNPMRSIGPAIASGNFHALWLYVVAPTPRGCAGRARVSVRPSGVGAAVSRVLFVCVQNAGRSQMAEALFTVAAEGRHEARSAGTAPAEHVHPEVVAAMRELGVGLESRVPHELDQADAEWADVIVTMGCGDACPYIPGKRYVDWELEDPAGLPPDEVRRIRDEIAERTKTLAGELA